MKAALLSLVALLPLGVAVAADLHSPVGEWQTIDDKTGKPRAIVQIYAQGDRLYGKILQSYTPGAEQRTCVRCSDDRKNKPMLGLQIIRNLRAVDGAYTGGEILDPEKGSTYRCTLTVSADGQTLNVRGYIGFSFLGRTQVWRRFVAPPAAPVPAAGSR